jgi:chaperonin GroES
MAKSSSILSSIKPTSGYVLIEPEEATKQTTSGIYLPDSATGDKPQQGKILAVGPDEVTEKGTTRKSPAKAKDKVIYKKWGGNEVKIDGKEYLFVKFEDILAVLS